MTTTDSATYREGEVITFDRATWNRGNITRLSRSVGTVLRFNAALYSGGRANPLPKGT